MDTYAPLEYREGIQVKGVNSNLVRAVVECLTEFGLKDVRPGVEKTTLQPSDVNCGSKRTTSW